MSDDGPDWVWPPPFVPITSGALMDFQDTSEPHGDGAADRREHERKTLIADALASQQLSALGRVSDLLREEWIAYWLFGGWAVDFYAGSVTRAHDDIDIAVWLEDVPRIMQLLEEDGWQHEPLDGEDGGTGYQRGSVRLELTYLVQDPEGEIFTPLRQGRGK
ncbi:MAG: nucleotidyltransferase family protein, partial [Gemmatimonadaceae bacterium]|nr:nucleotidyltransferase family protein [Gemmatimonadaceae bacterium]